MATIEASSGYPDEGAYWHLVETTLRDVFKTAPGSAALRVNEFLRRMADAPPAERLLGFHAEPFDIAAELLGIAATEAHASAYLGLDERKSWQLAASNQASGERATTA